MINSAYNPNSPDIIFQLIDGEYILLHLPSGNYFSLDNLGVLIWECVLNSIPVDEFIQALTKNSPELSAEIINSVDSTFESLLQEGLSVMSASPASDYSEKTNNLIKRIQDHKLEIKPAVLHAYKNIQEKYAHPCGVKEI